MGELFLLSRHSLIVDNQRTLQQSKYHFTVFHIICIYDFPLTHCVSSARAAGGKTRWRTLGVVSTPLTRCNSKPSPNTTDLLTAPSGKWRPERTTGCRHYYGTIWLLCFGKIRLKAPCSCHLVTVSHLFINSNSISTTVVYELFVSTVLDVILCITRWIQESGSRRFLFLLINM